MNEQVIIHYLWHYDKPHYIPVIGTGPFGVVWTMNHRGVNCGDCKFYMSIRDFPPLPSSRVVKKKNYRLHSLSRRVH